MSTEKARRVVDWRFLGKMAKSHRNFLKLGVREAGAQMGLSAATVSRLEHGQHASDGDTLVRVCQWLGLSVEDVCTEGEVNNG